nr:MAG TPA: hypothetical protein [Caudoviricetes sp.]
MLSSSTVVIGNLYRFAEKSQVRFKKLFLAKKILTTGHIPCYICFITGLAAA